MKKIQQLILASALASLTACSWWSNTDEDTNPYKGMTAQQLFKEADAAMRKKEYATAAKKLEALETMYPFSEYAEQSQLDLIYAYYSKDDFASCAASAERFIHMYPRAKHVDYAYYMKGLANFQQTRGTFANVLPLDESWRDPGTGNQAYTDFSQFVQRFPDSKYKRDALQRLIYLRNMFAQRELHIADFYFTRKMYVAAVERANYLVKTYPQAPSVQQALQIIIKANQILGLTQAHDEAVSVYRATYHANPKP